MPCAAPATCACPSVILTQPWEVVARLRTAWALAAVEGLAARRSVRQIAGDIGGTDASAVIDWAPNSDRRAQVRQLVKKARFLMGGGYLELAAGERPQL